MIKDIKEINFPEYATLSQATVNIADMGERSITTNIKISGDIVPNFSFDWEIEWKGERFIHTAREPQASKDNTSIRTSIDLTFKHWAIVELQRYYFIEMASTEAGTVIANKYEASLGLTLPDFIIAFNKVLTYYYGDTIQAVLNPAYVASAERSFVEINYSYIWDILQKVYEIYGCRWTLEPVTGQTGKYIIKFGYDAPEASHIFEYGYNGGLLKVERQVQSTDIRNILLGRGGEKNLPYLYFKDYSKYGNADNSNNGNFRPDPDAIPELKDLPFTELRSAEFRSYVQGWAAKYYGGTVTKSQAYVQWAWEKGYTDTQFRPVEHVKDDDSIAKYGEQWGALDNNEEIYPSIQGSGLDEVVAVEEMTNDYMTDEDAENDSVTANLNGCSIYLGKLLHNSDFTKRQNNVVKFSVPVGKTGNVLPFGEPTLVSYTDKDGKKKYDGEPPITDEYVVHDEDGVVYSGVGLQTGVYYIDWIIHVTNDYTHDLFRCTASIAGFNLTTANVKEEKRPTFDIWVKNLWNTTRGANETPSQYANRVWVPILGAAGQEAQVTFTTGLLSVSSDYQFTIVSTPVLDMSKSFNGEQSHWRITLGRSQAEYEATGKLIPNTGINAVPGDKFFFTGIELPHQYVVWAEERLHDYKEDNLITTSNIQPTWVVSIDKVRANKLEPGEVVKLVEQLAVGTKIRLSDKRLISGAPLDLYVQSATYTWNEPSNGSPYIYPDIEIVLSDNVVTVSNPVAELKGDISILQQHVGSLSNIQQIVRAVGDQLYLRKDGIEDISLSPTRFANLVTGSKFRQGGIGGQDWGFYRDANGRAVLEVDSAVIRDKLSVNSLVINQASYIGGMQIISAASIECSSVQDTGSGYLCRFDRKQGSAANLFNVDDVAMCMQWSGENETQKFYKRRVTEIGDDYIVLSKTDAYGEGIPQEKDTIIQYGNYTDAQRQYVIIRDVIGGGYERMLEGLNSVTSSGKQYYYAGRQSGSNMLWFVGDADNNQYAKYENGKLIISGQLTVNSKFQNADGSYSPLQEYLENIVGDAIDEGFDEYAYLKNALGESTTVTGGLVLTSLIQLGTTVGSSFNIYSGINGVVDSTKKGSGIAAWYGGQMIDRETYPDAQNYAKSLFRFDGSGYLSSGAITWDSLGNGSVGKDKYGNPVLSWNSSGVTLSNEIKLGTSSETLNSILAFMLKFNNMFELDMTSVPGKTVIKAKHDGFYSLGFISALGSNPDDEGGGSGAKYLFELFDVNITSPTNGQVLTYNGTNWVNATPQGGGLDTTQLAQYLTQNSYATQPWVQQQGYVTNSSLGNYVTIGTNQTITGGKVFSGNLGNTYGNWNRVITISRENNGCMEMTSNGFTIGLGVHGINKTWYWWFADKFPTNLSDSNAHYIMDFNGSRFKFHNKILTSAIEIIGGTSSQFLKADGSVDNNAYLPLSGGTMTGALNITANVDGMINIKTNDESNVPFIRFWQGVNPKTSFGWSNPYGSYIYNYSSNKYFGITDAGVPHFNMNTLWYSGNDGSGSGLDADLLDGVHRKWFIEFNEDLNGNNIDINSYSYPRDTGLIFQSIHFPNFSGYSNIPFNDYGQMITFGGYSSSFPFRLAYQQNSRIWFQGGGYKVYETFTFNGNEWKAIAFLSDNVASATKLQTPRTIWGQSFDGTGNISGNMTVNGTIHATSGIYSDSYVSALGQNTSSDARLKDIQRFLSLSVEDVANAPSVLFRWKESGDMAIGSIAQYWQRIIPEAVKHNRFGFLEMPYGNIALASVISVASKVLEHDRKVADHDRKFAEQERRIRYLESENRVLKNEFRRLLASETPSKHRSYGKQ